MASKEDLERTGMARLLKEAREYLDLSQDEVARELGVPRTAVSLIESGQRKVDAIELQKLAKLYQRPVGYFTGEEITASGLPEDVEHLAQSCFQAFEPGPAATRGVRGLFKIAIRRGKGVTP